MKLLIKNIKTLVQVRDGYVERVFGEEMKHLPCLENAWLAIDEGKIADYGPMDDFPGIADWKGLEILDASNRIVMPCYADSHTHIVYAGNREREFVDRINGLTYEMIAQRGGGILNSADLLARTSEEELYTQSMARLEEVIRQGTGAIEIKSGYGLDTENELKMLRVIKRIRETAPIPVKATFLAAHAVPAAYKADKAAYIDLIIHQTLPAVAKEQLADYIDVFCEAGYFSADETRRILEAGKALGLTPKVHAEQMSHSKGIQTAVACGAISADHLEFCSDEDIAVLKGSMTMPTVLPGAAFFLSLPLPPARRMIDAGLAVAFASDYNPGSSPSGNMNFMMSLGCIQYKLTPEECINAVTINSAYAMQSGHLVGSITPGKLANIFITKPISSYAYIPYAFGSQLIDTVILNGQVWKPSL